MATSLESVAGAPAELVLAGGKVYRFTKLTLDDWAEFCDAIKLKRRAGVHDAVLPGEDKRKLYAEIIRQTIDTDAMLAEAETLPGMKWLIHRALRKHHPELSADEAAEAVGSMERMAEVVGVIVDLPERDETDEDAGGTEDRPPTARS